MSGAGVTLQGMGRENGYKVLSADLKGETAPEAP